MTGHRVCNLLRRSFGSSLKESVLRRSGRREEAELFGNRETVSASLPRRLLFQRTVKFHRRRVASVKRLLHGPLFCSLWSVTDQPLCNLLRSLLKSDGSKTTNSIRKTS